MIRLPKAVHDEMIRHAKSCYPQEACGLVAGKGKDATAFLPIENMEHSTVSYLMDPRQQLRAFRRMREEKLDLLGIFHSHVASPAEPSQKDRSMAFYDDVSYLIVSLANMESPDLKSFRIANGKVAPEEIAVV
jgi:proteasome lid subunit RPN8/RPN11